MNIATPQTDTIIVGFDSAWTDAPKAPGAICASAAGYMIAPVSPETRLRLSVAAAKREVPFAWCGFARRTRIASNTRRSA